MNKKLNKFISEIVESIDCGMICFVNTDSFEMEDVPRELIEDPEEFEAMTGETAKNLDIKHTDWENYITIEPFESFESFKIMERFIEEVVSDRHLKYKLQNALECRKPFRNFKEIIDYSDYRQVWFDFKQKCLEEHVADLLNLELNKEN